jgi:type IV secretory pathway VirB2 component (pilin)
VNGKATIQQSLKEVLMWYPSEVQPFSTKRHVARSPRNLKLSLLLILLFLPLAAHAQGSPFDNGFTALQTLFTGTVAKVASLIAIVIGGYQFAHGEPGGKKALAGVAAGTGIAVLAANVLTWLWGV